MKFSGWQQIFFYKILNWTHRKSYVEDRGRWQGEKDVPRLRG